MAEEKKAEEFMMMSKRSLSMLQKESMRGDIESEKDRWRQNGIIQGRYLAETATPCDTADQLYEEAKRTWAGAGYSGIEILTDSGELMVSLKDLKGAQLPDALLVRLSQCAKEELPTYPWYSGALRGFLKGVTNKSYEIHKVIPKADGTIDFLLYNDPQALVRKVTPVDEKQMLTLEHYLQKQNLKRLQFNVVNADEQPGKVIDYLAEMTKMPELDVTCVTQTHPKLMREKLPIEARLVWLTPSDAKELSKNCYSIAPSAIEHNLIRDLGDHLAESKAEHKIPVVGITHLDLLNDVNGDKKVKEFLIKVGYKLADNDGLGLLALSYKSMDEKVAAAFARAAGG
jgi:hypothetical protein